MRRLLATVLTCAAIATTAAAAPLALEARTEIDALVSNLDASGCQFNRTGHWPPGQRASMTRTWSDLDEPSLAALAAAFGRSAPVGGFVGLTGDLGAGKTVFARAFARGRAVGARVTSPPRRE